MTDATTTTAPEFAIGDQVALPDTQRPHMHFISCVPPSGAYYYDWSYDRQRQFDAGMEGTVVKVFKHVMHVEVVGHPVYGDFTASFPKSIWALADPEAPRPRRIGEVPDGGIATDDPRIAWIWEDAAKVATAQRYCEQYDYITDKLNIPGRERDFTVTHDVDGITGTFRVKARSQKLANALVAEKLGNKG